VVFYVGLHKNNRTVFWGNCPGVSTLILIVSKNPHDSNLIHC